MKYSLGLDLGTTSVGWAVVNEDKQRIEDLGVRIFERPENPKSGESLAKPRRDARSTRHRIKRRRQRLNHLKDFFIQHQLLAPQDIDDQLFRKYDPYILREKAISEKLPNDQLFVALYHIAKRRGYKSNRKKVEAASTDNRKVLSAIQENQKLLSEYQSVAQALLRHEKFKSHKRNKLDSYTNSFIREDFEKEIVAILKVQKWPENDIDELLYQPPHGLFYQRPFMTEDLINKMRGKCLYEKGEQRAQKASYTFELFRLAQDLANLTYNDGEKLTPEQIQSCIEKAKNTQKVTYKALRETIGHKNDSEFKFDYIRGKREESYAEEEKHEFCNLKFYHDIKKATKDSPTDWQRIEEDQDLFDSIGYILTVNKDDDEVQKALTKLQLSSSTIDNLMGLSYSKFAHLSIKALRKLTPHLLSGETYDQAVEAEYPGEFTEKLSGDKNELPVLSEEEQNQITNPVVKRAINQTRKVVNAVIKKYGAPTQIKIECTNELSKNFNERMKIKKMQDENAANNKRIIELLQENFKITNPSGKQITKYKLWEEQLNKCQYCGKPLSLDIFIDDKLSEIDHIIPFSRCGNDGNINKVLVCSECNQEKANQTPFEKWGQDEKRWQTIKELAQNPNIKFGKRDRILAEKLPKEDWSQRALNDTRYIMKFMSQYIKKNIQFADDTKGKQKVLMPTGQITSSLRKMYGIGAKDRDINNCHHAVDACVIATASQAQIQKFALWHKYRELGARHRTVLVFNDDNSTTQVTTTEYEELQQQLPPWDNFAKEVILRSGMSYDAESIEDINTFRDKFRQFTTYDDQFLQQIHPMFVSRMPKRTAKGQAHKETIRSPKKTDDDRRLTRKRLADCDIKDIENSILPVSDKALYNQLKQLWQEKGKDAFKEPIYKNNKTVDKNGHPLSPVATIKVYSVEPSGILINHGTQFVNNGDTVCLNIYRRKDTAGKYKFFCAPVYVHSLHAQNIEILPTPNGRSAAEKAEYTKLKTPDGKIFDTVENGFEKLFSVYPNDYLRITYTDHIVEGYYVKYAISTGQISLIYHNQTSKDKDNLKLYTIGTAIDIEKLDISVLGDNYRPPKKQE